MLSTLNWIILVTVINGLVALVGAILFLFVEKKSQKFMIFFVSFTTGALLGGALIHFIPEAVEELSLVKTTILTLSGFIIFFLLETYLHWHHCHDGKCEKHPFTYLLLWGDGIHNLLDGVIIGITFLVNPALGSVSAVAIALHEIPQEISEFGVLVYAGFAKRKALLLNFLSATTVIIGGIIGFTVGESIEAWIPHIVMLAVGSFLYIAASDFVPEIRKEESMGKSFNIFVIFGAGIALMWVLTLIE